MFFDGETESRSFILLARRISVHAKRAHSGNSAMTCTVIAVDAVAE